MQDISDEKKKKIRCLARSYCTILSKIPFEKGMMLYSKTHEYLQTGSARWRITRNMCFPKDRKCSNKEL